MHFLLAPYYWGMIAHRSTGGLEPFYLKTLLGQWGGEICQRFAVHEANGVGTRTVGLLWFSYLCSTLGLGVIAVTEARRKAS